nr:hypothetical protein [Pandoravirus massiliensis]
MTETRHAMTIAQHFTHACDLDALCALDGMACVAAGDDALDLWQACALQVDAMLAERVASHRLLTEVMSCYLMTTAGSVVEARDAWYRKITEGGETTPHHVVAVLDALDDLAHGAIGAIGEPKAHALEQQAKAWAHARRMRLFWANVDATVLRIEQSLIACAPIRNAHAVMCRGTLADAMTSTGTNAKAVILLCGIVMDLNDVMGSAEAMSVLTVAVERVCVPFDCVAEESTTD